MSARLTLVLGGARSGKSRRAETLARESEAEELIYLATGQAFDAEMEERIAKHKADRADDGWITVEEPLDLAGALQRECATSRVVLVECLTTWLGNLMAGEQDISRATSALIEYLDKGPDGKLVFVANEVGLGIVPTSKMGRDFRDIAGKLNQQIAERADRVEFVAAGLPMVLKG